MHDSVSAAISVKLLSGDPHFHAERRRSVSRSNSIALKIGMSSGIGMLVGMVMTMLLAWKTELSRFAGGLQMTEIRSAVLLGLIGFAVYPMLPNRYIHPWQLFNPRDA